FDQDRLEMLSVAFDMPAADLDGPALRSRALRFDRDQGIAQQIHEDLDEAVGIAGDLDGGGDLIREGNAHSPFINSDETPRFVDDWAEENGLEVVLARTGEVEEAGADQTEPFGNTLHASEAFQGLRIRGRRGRIGERLLELFDGAVQHRERRVH